MIFISLFFQGHSRRPILCPLFLLFCVVVACDKLNNCINFIAKSHDNNNCTDYNVVEL